MKRKIKTIGIIILLLLICLSGCNELSNSINQENKEFVGTWKYYHSTMTISSDGTGKYNGDPIDWEVKDGKFVIDHHALSSRITYYFSFYDNNETLELTRQDIVMEWIKVE